MYILSFIPPVLPFSGDPGGTLAATIGGPPAALPRIAAAGGDAGIAACATVKVVAGRFLSRPSLGRGSHAGDFG